MKQLKPQVAAVAWMIISFIWAITSIVTYFACNCWEALK